MSIVTVLGAHGQIVSLSFDTDANAALAGKLAAAITAGVRNGSIAPAADTDGPPPPLRRARPANSSKRRWPRIFSRLQGVRRYPSEMSLRLRRRRSIGVVQHRRHDVQREGRFGHRGGRRRQQPHRDPR